MIFEHNWSYLSVGSLLGYSVLVGYALLGYVNHSNEPLPENTHSFSFYLFIFWMIHSARRVLPFMQKGWLPLINIF
jgi:hypothetical protein